jgi:hypothetical protein
MNVAEHRIVGAMTLSHGRAAFDRAPVVVESGSEPGTFLRVRGYVEPHAFEGKPFDADDWRGLLRSEQAIAIPPVALVNGAALWVLRPVFHGREAALAALRALGILLYDVVRLTDGSFGCLVHETNDALDLRDRWADEASEEARTSAHHGDWENARTAASRAFVIERAMSPERIAMLSLAHARCGNTVGSEGYVQMARNSRGDAFAQRVLDRRAALEQQLEQPPRSGPRPRCSTQIQKKSAGGVRNGLARLSDKKAVACRPGP